MRGTTTLILSIIVGTATPLAGQTEHGAFIMTLGQDTVAIDQYARTKNFIDGALLLRSPVTRVATYRARLHEDGSILRLESRWWTPTPKAGPPQPPDVVATFEGDSITIDFFVGEDVKQVTVAALPGSVPLINSVYNAVLYEQALRQGFSRGERDFSADWVALDRGGRASSTSVAPRGQDSVSIGFFAGTLVARVDDQGHILGIQGEESTARFLGQRVADVDLEPLAIEFGMRDAAGTGLGSMSPRDSATGSIEDANLTIDYSRPSKRGRQVWGGIVRWDEVWRTGANRATHFTTDHDLVIAGVEVPAGSYTLFTWNTAEGSQLIISRQTGQWGTVYVPANDLARIPLEMETLDPPVEQFTIAVRQGDGGAMLALEWDDRRYWVPVAVVGD